MERAILFSGNPTFNGPFTVNIYLNSPCKEENDKDSENEDQADYIVVRKATKENYEGHFGDQSCYRISRYPKGRVLLINNEFAGEKGYHRKGSCVDVYKMTSLWEEIGCEVVIQDLTAEKLLEAVDNFVNNKVSTDFCVVIVMSHGDQDDLIVGSEQGRVAVAKIVDKITNCEHLEGKPKLVFFQMCRGDKVQKDEYDAGSLLTGENTWIMDMLQNVLQNGRILGSDVDEADAKACTYVSSNPDVLLAFATQPDHRSFRHTERGSWFIHCIAKVFGEHAADHDVRELMVMVQKELKNFTAYAPGCDYDKGKEEVDGIDTFGKKRFWLFPGFPKPYKEN